VIIIATLPREQEDEIFQIIDKVLKHVFGKEATEFIYDYSEQYYSLPRSALSERIYVFAKGIEACLSSGAFAKERKILEANLSGLRFTQQNEFRKT